MLKYIYERIGGVVMEKYMPDMYQKSIYTVDYQKLIDDVNSFKRVFEKIHS